MKGDRGTARRLAGEDLDGFEELFTTERAAMVRLAVLLVDSHALAEEIVQDAFASIARRWSTLERPAAYLRTSVVNGCRMALRRREVQRRVEPPRAVLPVDAPGELVESPTHGPPPVAYRDAMFAGDEAAVFRYWAPEFVSHVTGQVAPDAVGTDVRCHEVRRWNEVRSAFPDFTFSVDLLIEKDDLVVSNWTVKGTHTGTAFFGVEPSGEPIDINGTAILRIRDGQIVEHWGGPHCLDGLGLSHAPTAAPRFTAPTS